MPMDIEVAGEDIESPEGALETPEAGSEDLSPEVEPGDGGTPAPAKPDPQYFSHDDARSFMSEAVGRLEQNFTRLLDQRFASFQPQPTQPATPDAPLFPKTQAELDKMMEDPWAWVKMTERAYAQNQDRLATLEENFNKFKGGYETQGRTSKVIQWLDDQCMEGIEGLDSFVDEKGEVDAGMYDSLKALVTGYIRERGMKGLNVKSLAKALHDRIERKVDARYKKKIKPPPPGTPPTKPDGSGSKPAIKQPETRQAAKKGFRAAIRGLRASED